MAATILYQSLLWAAVAGAAPQEPPDEIPMKPDNAEDEPKARRSFGGLQLWADVAIHHGYRLQVNVLNDDHRLLDPSDRILVAGSQEDCKRRWDAAREKEGLAPEKGEIVLLLHGIVRTHHSMKPLARHLSQHGYTSYSVSYPSTRKSIEYHAENLTKIVDGFADAKAVHFVGHSMGGLIVRAMLANHPKRNIGRLVMLGTPNQGAAKADFWGKTKVYRWVMGKAGEQLQTGSEGIVDKLPETLPIEFGIIAGGRSNGRGYSMMLKGDDDGTVTVESTRLAGARDFRVVPVIHTFLMNPQSVHDYVLCFLQKGWFESEETRRPIEAAE